MSLFDSRRCRGVLGAAPRVGPATLTACCLVIAMALLGPGEARGDDSLHPFHELWRQGGDRGFAAWSTTNAVIDSSGAHLVKDDSTARAGEVLGPEIVTSEPFRELIPSWNAVTPPGAWIEVDLRAKLGDRWTRWYALGSWSSDDVDRRHSVNGQDDDDAAVLTDTLRLRLLASRYQLRVRLLATGPTTPIVRAITVLASRRSDVARPLVAGGSAWGTALDVPRRSQLAYPGGGEVWCSPTSTSMVMAYWAAVTGSSALDHDVPRVAAGAYDSVYEGNGNWPFNTAYAARAGLQAYVTRFSSLAQVERWISAGVPVIASLAWERGQLSNAPVASTDGHLLVIVGFTADGDVVVNEPAADPRMGQDVRRVYSRGELERQWLTTSGGAVYLMYPDGFGEPTDDALGAW